MVAAKAPAKKTAAKVASKVAAASQPPTKAAEKRALDRIAAEAKAKAKEAGYDVGYLVDNDGVKHMVRIKDQEDWTSIGLRAMRFGDFESWAEDCLAEGDYYGVWRIVRPTLRQVNAFIDSWEDATGQDVGESEAS